MMTRLRLASFLVVNVIATVVFLAEKEEKEEGGRKRRRRRVGGGRRGADGDVINGKVLTDTPELLDVSPCRRSFGCW